MWSGPVYEIDPWSIIMQSRLANKKQSTKENYLILLAQKGKYRAFH
jgi:hypothetical protein